MLSRNTTVFLLIASAYWFCAISFFEIRQYFRAPEYFRDDLSEFIHLGIILLLPVVFGLMSIGLGNNNEQLRRTGALLLAVLGGVWLCSDIYNQYTYFQHPGSAPLPEEKFGFVRHIVNHWLIYVPSLSFLLAGLLLAGNNRRNHKRAAMWLITGAVPYLCSLFFSIIYTTLIFWSTLERDGPKWTCRS